MPDETAVKPDPTQPVLSLDTAEPKRATVVIKTKEDPEGQMYELAAMEDLSLQMQQKVSARGAEFTVLWSKPDLSDNQTKRLRQIADDLLGVVVLKLPDDVRDQLRDWDKVRLIEAFTKASKLVPEANQTQSAPAPSQEES